jgi:TfoX/Sxy family transcriptional regulator of competence genes
MSSDLAFVQFVMDQLHDAGRVTYKKMFGEYAIYCDGKVVALICDDQLFVRPTKVGIDYVGHVAMAPPYPKAKPYFLIDEQLDDHEWLSELIRLSATELPYPKAKKKK